VNTLLLDAPAAAAVGRALGSAAGLPGAAASGDQGHAPEPMLTVPIELRDADRARCTVFTAAVGTPLRHVLDAAGLKIQGLTFRAGAALRDVKVSCDAIIDGGELTVDAGRITPLINPDPCIRCGWCVESCPVRIHPAGLLEAAQETDQALAEHYGLHACIECGVCSYVCPSRLPLLDSIRELRVRQRAGATR
jgi:Na+-translocating ferredoxin:NAD+ oxidoreductase RnfC subunit